MHSIRPISRIAGIRTVARSRAEGTGKCRCETLSGVPDCPSTPKRCRNRRCESIEQRESLGLGLERSGKAKSWWSEVFSRGEQAKNAFSRGNGWFSTYFSRQIEKVRQILFH